MTQQWADQKNKEHAEKAEKIRAEVVTVIQSLPEANDEQKAALMAWLEEEEKHPYPCMAIGSYRLLKYSGDNWDEYLSKKNLFERYDAAIKYKNMYDRFVDSEPKRFDGDIVITDPCYILCHDDDRRDDWEKCDYGNAMEELGITTYMTRDTIYGDWSCTTYNSDTKEEIGQFCADAGLVSVFLLDEIRSYNPDFEKHHLQDRDWTATLIKNFKGDVQFIVELETGVYEEDTPYYKAGDTWEDYIVRVVGHGVNKVTGESINFITSQTGL